jgi:uncharacterized membrane protein
MKDQSPDRQDDAPLTTSKDDDAVEKLEGRIPDPHGDSLSGTTVTINRSRAELFAYWRDFTNLPSFMDNVESITVIDPETTHWIVRAPAGKSVEWDAKITDERESEYIAWTSMEGADVTNSGRVDFRDATGGRGTAVTATVVYDPPGGTIGKIVAKMFQREPAIQARRDLRRFKQLMETGEIATAAVTREQSIDERQ